MGWFGRLSRKKDKQAEVINETIKPAQEKSIKPSGSKMERLHLIQENCEQLNEYQRQIEELKLEYQAVTSYLTDLQKIDMIPLEERVTLEDAARRIISLSQERKRLRDKSSLLSDSQYRLFESYEHSIMKEMEKIGESEQFQVKIEHDLEQLEEEKQAIIEEEKQIIEKHSFLKGLAIIMGIIVTTLFLIFLLLKSTLDADLSLPFFLTIIMGSGLSMYIYFEGRKNQYDIKIVEAKAKKVISLINKIKIKSVNNRNYLDYTYNKYMVESYDQLKYRWIEYVKLKDEMARYQQNTELMDFYNVTLIKELKRFAIADAEIWIYQPDAIVDRKEMVEVRHRLNVRRQKLRERIETNNRLKETMVDEITAIVKESPDCQEEALKILKRCQLS